MSLPPLRNPSIFINTLPKSGSIFISLSLQASTDMDSQRLAYGCYPNDMIDYQKALEFSLGGRIAQEHLDASPRNLRLLEKYAKHWVLHLRDPRSSMISWIHHLDLIHNRGDLTTVEFSDPFLPPDYFTWDMLRKIDWQIDHYLAQSVKWIRDWNDYYTQHPDRVLVTSYKELHEDSAAFLAGILRHFNIEKEVKLVEKTKKNHFRSGMIDEWKTVCTPPQIQKASDVCSELKGLFTGVDYLSH